jgi:rare lipoprotein A (peptidoglycan hydrolase)
VPRPWLLVGLLLAVGCARNVRPGGGEEGEASWYGPGLYGRRTASGEVLRPGDFTAAHRTLPFGTCLRVLNLDNGRSVEVRVNDRGPFASGRILDVSEAAARALGMHGRGVVRVRLERCGSAEGTALGGFGWAVYSPMDRPDGVGFPDGPPDPRQR